MKRLLLLLAALSPFAFADTSTNTVSEIPQTELANGALVDAWTVRVDDEIEAAALNGIQPKQTLVISTPQRTFHNTCAVASVWVAPDGGACFLEVGSGDPLYQGTLPAEQRLLPRVQGHSLYLMVALS